MISLHPTSERRAYVAVGYLFEPKGAHVKTEHTIGVLLNSELGLDQKSATALAAEMWSIEVDRGEFLCLQGERSDRFFVVASGSFAIQASSVTGRELVFTSLGPGAPIGEVSVFDATPRSAAIRAVDRSEVLAIGREAFLRLVAEHPSIGLALARHLARIVRRLSENVEGSSFLPLSERLVEVMFTLALDGGNPAGGPWQIRATQQQLADRLGSSRESVNKLLRSWSKAGLLEIQRGALTVSDGVALRAAVQP